MVFAIAGLVDVIAGFTVRKRVAPCCVFNAGIVAPSSPTAFSLIVPTLPSSFLPSFSHTTVFISILVIPLYHHVPFRTSCQSLLGPHDRAPLMLQSKYRHVYGEKSKVTYENAKISGSAWDTNLVTAGGKYIAVNWQVSGGGVSTVPTGICLNPR